MPLAKAAPNAINKPTNISVVVSVLPNAIAALEAISRFEGPANGIRLKPKPNPKINNNSMIDVVLLCPLTQKLTLSS
jgi:hypothetical protein